uniref:Putative secreted protein n=1 Tax=Amblyomma americanum TaxID=6943 RepID=A0A0C9SFF3_AMBAM
MLPLVVSLLIASVLPGVYSSNDFSRNTNNPIRYKLYTSNLLGSYTYLAIILGAESPLNLDLDRCLKTQYNGSYHRGFKHLVTYRHQRSDDGAVNWPQKHINVWIDVSIVAGYARVNITSLEDKELPQVLKGPLKVLYAKEDCFLLEHGSEDHPASTLWLPFTKLERPPQECINKYKSKCRTERRLDYKPWKGLCGFSSEVDI